MITAFMRNRKRGSVAIICLAMISVVLVITMSLACESVTRLALTRKNLDRDKAHCLAEAGIDYSLSMLKSNSSYQGTSAPVAFGEGAFEVTVVTVSGTKIITSTGTHTNGATATIEVEASTDSYRSFPNGAIVANGSVQLSGQADVKTSPLNEHQASVRSNANITLNGQPEVDGSVTAHGTVTLSGQPSIYDGVENGAPLIDFMTKAEHDAWQAELMAEAQDGTLRSGSVKSNQTWNSPVYVNGDLSVSSKKTLTLTGGGVVFVNGNISISGQGTIKNEGCILVATGKIDFTGQSTYTVTGNQHESALISFDTSSGDNPAIKVAGQGDASPLGIVYAANGGIKIVGQGDVYGALVAAGADGRGTVKIAGQGNLFYPIDLLKNNEVIPGEAGIKSWLEL